MSLGTVCRLLLVLGFTILASGPASVLPAAAAAGNSDTFTFQPPGDPGSPQVFRPADWDVIVHSRDVQTWEQPQAINAEHGSDCSPPPATHLVQSYADSVFVCKNHLMTAINAEGYGAIYLTPAHLLDLSRGTGLVDYDVSTARNSSRDWHDLWVSSFDDNLVVPLYFLPDMQGPPRRAIHIQLSSDNTFQATLFQDFKAIDLPRRDWTPYDRLVTPSATSRARFELRLTRTHVRFGIPLLNLWWIDTDIPDLGFDKGVVQFGHHSYNPTKAAGGKPGTWHWGGFQISPSIPFSLLRADVDSVNAGTRSYACFGAPAPSDAHLRFAAVGDIQVSFDGGRTFQAAVPAAQVGPHGEGSPQTGLFASYWTPIPPGTSNVVFSGTDWWGGPWFVRDPAIWALSGPAPVLPADGICAGGIAGLRQPPPRSTTVTSAVQDRDRWLWALLPRLSHGELFTLALAVIVTPLGAGLLLGVWGERWASRSRRRWRRWRRHH